MSANLIPARSGVAAFVNAYSKIRIINTAGHQVVDTWAFPLPSDPSTRPHKRDGSAAPVEFLSMSHSRVAMNSLRPYVGATLVSNRSKPVFKFVHDTSPGIHDTVFAPAFLLEMLFLPELEQQGGYHENCSDNLHIALQQALASATNDADGLDLSKIVAGLKGHTPDPLNIFMNIPWRDGKVGQIDWERPQSKPGDYVELEAQRDLVVAMSACPNDVTDINGGKPTDAHYEIID
ncbi:MAG: hypothetical protein Q9162_000104 [Coniocarpon cinnabarinum]